MADFSQKDVDRVDIIRRNVEDAEDYFESNKKRFSEDKNFVFKTTVTAEDANALNASEYPVLDINVIEPYLHKYSSNFNKQSPEIEIRSEDKSVSPDQVDVIEGITRAIFYGSNYKNTAPRVVRDQLCGWGVWEVDVDYKNKSSFDKVVSLSYADPLMCGFDPMATGVSKEDAKYYYKLYPMTRNELKEEYPSLNLDNIDNMPLNQGSKSGRFRWKKRSASKEIYYIADYYEKKFKKTKYYQISDPQNPRAATSISQKDYEEQYPNPDDPMNPNIIQEKNKLIPSIKRYKIIGSQLLDKPEDIDGSHNRLIFVDCSSVNLENQQYTRPYFYNVKDAQRVKNRCLSNAVYEMMTMRKTNIVIPEEALPESQEAINAWKDVDRSKGALLRKAFKKDGTPLPGIETIPSGTINQQTIQLFEISDKTIQSQFGSYDAQRGIQNDVSGKAIMEGAMESSGSSSPLITNYMAALKQIAMVVLDLIPLYYTTMRTMPFIEPDGSKKYISINDPDSPETVMDYDVNYLGIEVEAGPSFDVQRRDSLDALIKAMPLFPALAEILNGDGLSVAVKNFDIKDRQRLLQLVEQHNEQKKKAAQSQPNQMQMQMQAMMAEEKRKDQLVDLKHQEVTLKATKQQQDFMMDVEKLRQSNEKLQEELMEIKATLILRAEEAQNEADRTQAEMAMKQVDAKMSQERHQVEMLEKVSGAMNVDNNQI